MVYDIIFFANNALLGVGLAMDAFSVSLANGLNEPNMSIKRTLGIAGVFAFFQAAMPMIGWVCVHHLIKVFTVFEGFIPYIALILLGFIGVKMIIDGVKGAEEEAKSKMTLGALLVQGVATSIDALSVGFTIAEYDAVSALISALIIAAVTFVICASGVVIGKKFGTKLAGKATILGGVILIAIGLEIFLSGILG